MPIFLLFLIAHIIFSASSQTCFFSGECYDSGAAQFYFESISSLPTRDLLVRTYILSNDDGSAQIVSDDFTSEQILTLNEYFKSTGVRFSHQNVLVRNSSLRIRYALPMCDFALIGNNQCDSLCNVTVTNFDGGDCLPVPDSLLCTPGICDERCNIAKYEWDNGDCCQEPYTDLHCRDPRSPYKVYYTPDDIKSAVTPLQTDSWNIYIIQFADCMWCGAESTLPAYFNAYDPTAQGTIYNGMLANKSFIFQVGVHEAGHTFGLLHPFTGSESGTFNCSDPCFDGVQYPIGEMGSEYIGDLISDTRPMIVTYECSDPPGADCAGEEWIDTPYRNIMSFGHQTPGCTNSSTAFTDMQRGRMKCFAETLYNIWWKS